MLSALVETQPMLNLGGLVVVGAFVAFIILIVTFLYRATIFFGSARKEQMLLRLEMGKLAEEVQQLRERLQEPKGGNRTDDDSTRASS